MSDEPSAVSIARLEATLEGIKNQIDHGERTSQQIARLAEERFTARFDSLDRRLSDMDAARERARKEEAHAREALELKQTAIELRVTALERFDIAANDKRHNDVDSRVTAVENWKSKVVGICIGVSLATGGVTAAVLKAIGGVS